MTVRPILFSGPMIGALLDGRKTQTRRVLNRARVFATPERPAFTLTGDDMARALQNADRFRRIEGDGWFWEADAYEWQAPHTRTGWMAHIGYAPGDLLYVRESFGSVELEGGGIGNYYIVYDADEWSREHKGKRCGMPQPKEWRPSPLPCKLYPSIHMPRRLSRLTLEVTDVRVQRVQEMSWEDAEAEGVWHASQEYREQVCIWRDAPSRLRRLRIEHFAKLWDSLNAKRGYGWEVNPWVCAVSFRCIRKNIDEVLRDQAS